MNIRKAALLRAGLRKHFSSIKKTRRFRRVIVINLPELGEDWLKAMTQPGSVLVLEDNDSTVAEMDRLTQGEFSKFMETYPKPQPVTIIDPGNKFRDMDFLSLIKN